MPICSLNKIFPLQIIVTSVFGTDLVTKVDLGDTPSKTRYLNWFGHSLRRQDIYQWEMGPKIHKMSQHHNESSYLYAVILLRWRQLNST